MWIKRGILKHLRQFVQSDWFLPVFISHDKDTASGLWIDPFKRRLLGVFGLVFFSARYKHGRDHYF